MVTVPAACPSAWWSKVLVASPIELVLMPVGPIHDGAQRSLASVRFSRLVRQLRPNGFNWVRVFPGQDLCLMDQLRRQRDRCEVLCHAAKERIVAGFLVVI